MSERELSILGSGWVDARVVVGFSSCGGMSGGRRGKRQRMVGVTDGGLCSGVLLSRFDDCCWVIFFFF